MKILDVYVDGACVKNPGPGGYAYVIVDPNGVIIKKASGVIGNCQENPVRLWQG